MTTTESRRTWADGFREQSLATLEAHPAWTRAWLEATYPAEDEADRPDLADLSSDDLADAAAQLAEELEGPDGWD